MTTADEMARYLPYWQCKECGIRVFKVSLQQKSLWCHCDCDGGDSRWNMQNRHLLDWAEAVIG